MPLWAIGNSVFVGAKSSVFEDNRAAPPPHIHNNAMMAKQPTKILLFFDLESDIKNPLSAEKIVTRNSSNGILH